MFVILGAQNESDPGPILSCYIQYDLYLENKCVCVCKSPCMSQSFQQI